MNISQTKRHFNIFNTPNLFLYIYKTHIDLLNYKSIHLKMGMSCIVK